MKSINPWFCPVKSDGPDEGLKLFCFHSAGSGASFYFDWADKISSVKEIIAIQLPGREGRYSDGLITCLEQLTERLWANLKNELDQPYIFFGHSMGARIAYEIAKIASLSETGGPECLIVSGAAAPHIASNTNDHLLPDDQLLIKLMDYGGTDTTLFESKELMDLILPILRADLKLCELAQTDQSSELTCPIIAYGGREDEIDISDIDAWRMRTTNQFILKMFEGGHFFVKSNQNKVLDDLAEVVNLIECNSNCHRHTPSVT
jgi:medium-chain acyl-[acyl-carrier-protein] hydrolase